LTDVLDHHRARNRPNKPPSQERLLDAARRQLGISDDEGGGEDKADDGEEDKAGDGEEEEAEEDEDDGGRKRAVRHSKSDGTVKATTAKYYTGSWKAAILRAKSAFRRYTVLQYLFPLRDSHLEEAALILSQTVTTMEGKVAFDPSEFSLRFYCPSTRSLFYRVCSRP
jgi:hypothetical protein